LVASEKTILVVEDEEAVRQLAIAQLESAGYSTLAAPDAEEALALLQEHSPAAILLDLDMPGMGGLDMLAELKKGASELPPVIAFSAYVDIDLVFSKTMELGVRAHVLKPYNRRDLLDAVSDALNGRSWRSYTGR